MTAFASNLSATTLVLLLTTSLSARAAERVRLDSLDPETALSALTGMPGSAASGAALRDSRSSMPMKLLSQRVDPQGITRSRYQQLHEGLPVFGEHIIVAEQADGSVHAVSGTLLHGLPRTLSGQRNTTISQEQARQRARADALSGDAALLQVTDMSSQQVVHVDAQGQARIAWAVRFFADLPEGGQPTRPVRLVDAATGAILAGWDSMTTERIGTGPGGNVKTGRYEYGATMPLLDVQRRSTSCWLLSPDVKTINLNHTGSGTQAHAFTCPSNQVKPINGAFSPLNDAHHFGGVVFDMYRRLLGVRPLPFQLELQVHYGRNYDNAGWNGRTMVFGDGATQFHPLVALDVVAHEVSHGFTEQHSDLIYAGQSGGINEAFSDMAGEAADFGNTGSTTYLVGDTIFKGTGALRYMDDPTRDGHSIAHASQFQPGMDVHLSSGVYNRAFYLLSRTPGWDMESAFKAFAQANMDHWTPSTDFNTGACGVERSAIDLGYNPDDVTAAFQAVGVSCQAPVR